MRVLSSRSVVARQSRFFSSTPTRSSKNEKKALVIKVCLLSAGCFFFQLFFLRWWVHRSLGQKRDECEQKVQFFAFFDEKNFKFSPLLRAAFASSCTSCTSFTSSKTFSSRAIIISRERKRERERESAKKTRRDHFEQLWEGRDSFAFNGVFSRRVFTTEERIQRHRRERERKMMMMMMMMMMMREQRHRR